MSPLTASRRLRTATLAAVLLAGLLVPAAASDAASQSSNWAGYVAVARAGSHSGFTSVSGVWTQPAVSCTTGHESFSAVWVGSGGYREGARALEQVGTDADCTRSGRAVYAAWFELLPAAPISVRVGVRPGDELVAAVTVSGHDVTFGIRDLTRGARFAKTVRVAVTDLSSAEWIVEAPSVCADEDSCHTLALADFGEAAFAHATATVRGHTGPVGDRSWTHSELELQQRSLQPPAGGGNGGGAARRPQADVVVGVPSPLATVTGAFSVTWQERLLSSELPVAPTFPGD